MFSGYSTFFLGDGEIVIGEDTYLGDHGHIGTVEGSTVKIGRKCRLGSFLEIRTVNSVANQDFSREELDSHVGDVCIGDFVWTGSHVFIREGVTIGDNVVVGAYSVVTHSFPSDVVVAGCPA